MVRNPKVQYAVLGGALAVLLAILAWHFLLGERPPSADELARLALEAPTPSEREIAAVRLAGRGKEAKDHLQRVLAESQLPAVRAACIQGLASQWDYDSMPAFLKALEDQSPVVRGGAATAIQRLLAVDLGYVFDDPPEKRQQAVQRISEYWETMRDSPLLRSWKKRRQERGS